MQVLLNRNTPHKSWYRIALHGRRGRCRWRTSIRSVCVGSHVWNNDGLGRNTECWGTLCFVLGLALVELPASKYWIQGFVEEESGDGNFDVRPSRSSSIY